MTLSTSQKTSSNPKHKEGLLLNLSK